MLKKAGFFFLALLLVGPLFLGLDHLFHPKSNRLTPFKINAFQPHASEWGTSALSYEERADIRQILNQKFTYYNKGSQAYVFLSEDQRYVLKFIKQHTLRPNSWLCFIPLSFNPYYKKHLYRQKRAQDTFRACKLAFTNFKEETALVYLHLNSTQEWNQKVTLFDEKGEKVTIDIDKTCFLIQKKATLIFTRIAELMAQKDTEGAKKIISSVFSLIDALGRKGVVDNDPIIRKNFALIDDQAVQIDIGKMKVDPTRIQTSAYKRDIPSITGPFGSWIERSYPELSPHFQENVQRFSS